MDFYEKILLYKAKNKVPYKALGEPISLTPDAMRMALDRQSLSDLQKNELRKVFGIEQSKTATDMVSENEENYKTTETDLPPLDLYRDIDIISYINQNKERFKQIRLFQMLMESINLDNHIEDVKKEVDNIIAKYLKARQDQ